MIDDELSLTVGGTTISGWTELRVTRGVERCPNDFDLALTDVTPETLQAVVVNTGDACEVRIGPDLVITGYVNRVVPSVEAESHTIRVTGRGKCQDLVDCSGEWPGGQISGASALDIAQKFAGPYSLTAVCDEDPGPAIPQFNMMIGETGWDIVERVCRFAALLVYEGPDGNLRLARAGKVKAASGFTYGQNVLRAEVVFADDERFSEYDCFRISTQTLGDLGDGGNLYARVPDPNVKRHRLRYLIAEGGSVGVDLCQRRAAWEQARRAGRARAATFTVDSWRDSAGTLWTPNTLAPLSLGPLKLEDVTWLIGEVTYKRGSEGSTAEILMMAPDAFMPEPIALQPTIPDLAPQAGRT